MITKTIKIFAAILLAVIIIQSCKKDDEINPYDDPSLKAPDKSGSEASLDPNSFEYLYKYIFKPTCANSSCHDGSFEPDFRTMNGAYNTLVYQPVKSNDFSFTYTYRVLPGNANMSLICRRLTQVPYNEIGQGRMPGTIHFGNSSLKMHNSFRTSQTGSMQEQKICLEPPQY